jgi:hypothetical protein
LSTQLVLAPNYTIILEITDSNSMLLSAKYNSNSLNTSSKKSFKQQHVYKVRIIADNDMSVTCTVRNDTHGGQYCGICEDGFESECTLNVTAQPIAGIADVSGEIPALQGWLIGLGLGFVGLGAIAFFFTFKTMEQHAEENVGEILPLCDELIYLRYVLLVCQAIMMLVSTFVIMYTAYMFIVVSIFGRTMVLGICIVACFCWFFSFVGFTGAYFNNRQVVFSSFILSIFFLALTLIFTGMLLHTQMNLDGNEDVFLQLRSEWQQTVKSDAATACKMESYLYCSGWDQSCVTFQNGPTSNCPDKCEVANQIAFPCWPKVQAFVRKHFYNAAVGGIVLAIFLLIIMILSLIFGCGMKINKARITRQRYKRAQEGRNTLSDNELGMLRNEFRKVDKQNTGQITRDQFAKFYSKTMGVPMNKDQLQEYFDALDTDGSGTLSFEEFVKIYMPAVDVTEDMIEQEKKREQARVEERNRLIYGDKNGKSPGAANIDPLGAAALADIDAQRAQSNPASRGGRNERALAGFPQQHNSVHDDVPYVASPTEMSVNPGSGFAVINSNQNQKQKQQNAVAAAAAAQQVAHIPSVAEVIARQQREQEEAQRAFVESQIREQKQQYNSNTNTHAMGPPADSTDTQPGKDNAQHHRRRKSDLQSEPSEHIVVVDEDDDDGFEGDEQNNGGVVEYDSREHETEMSESARRKDFMKQKLAEADH